MPDPMQFPHEFVDTPDGLREVLVRLTAAVKVAIDTETEVVDDDAAMRRGELGAWCVTSIAARFADGSETLWVVDMSGFDPATVAPLFAPLRAYAWNANFERQVFARGGVSLARWDDLMLHQAVLAAGAATKKAFYMGLADAAYRYLGLVLEGKKSIQLSYRRGVPLSEEQIAYAGQDAIVTLWLSDALEARLDAVGLRAAAERESAAQAFVSSMTREGLAFDVEGWRSFLAASRAASDQALARLAELTGGSELTLFGPSGKPDWNPASKDDVVRILNAYEPERVAAYQRTWNRGGRQLDVKDPLEKEHLMLIGGDIVDALLEYRKHEKRLSTYGEKLLALLGPEPVDPGSDRPLRRFHSEYKQALTATGRLSSDKPNAQNFDPAMKAYLRPSSDDRVFVCADYSQAELRFLAQVTGDAAMIGAFVSGDDLHAVTAARMFNLALEAVDASSRKKAKPINFGIGYGVGARKLAIGLSVGGTPTLPPEAKRLLERWLEIYPDIAAWLAERDRYVIELSQRPGPIDFAATWRLYDAFGPVNDAYWKLRHRAQPTSDDAIAREILGADAADVARLERAVEQTRWVRSFDAPVVLRDPSTPFEFESRTLAGRRRLFQVSADDWIDQMVVMAATSKKERPAALRDAWARERGTSLVTPSGRPYFGAAVLKTKALVNRPARADFARFVLRSMPEGADYLMREALADRIRQKKNEYRNHPIQGGVGDALLDAFALLDERLGRFSHAVPVQSVHDSLVIECDAAEAVEVRDVVVTAMTEALAAYLPDVPVKVDADIQRSLDAGRDTLEDADLAELLGLDETYALV